MSAQATSLADKSPQHIVAEANGWEISLAGVVEPPAEITVPMASCRA
jgi:hypothetical protein